MLLLSKALKLYKRGEIQEEIIANAQNREIAIKYGEKGFGKRPDILKYPNDILDLAKQGATSFHASEELWKNPLQLDPMLSRKELEQLRSGWDLVLDIDCEVLEYSALAADLLVKAIKYYGIQSVSCKFSGNKGFHIGVPFEAFPSTVGKNETSILFPEGARAIALYLRDMIKEPLSKKILELEKKDFSKIVEKTGKKPEEIKKAEKSRSGYKVVKLDVDSFLNIDTVLISSRHLYRMPYSLHEKSMLASLPINPDKILEFNKELASPETLKVSEFRFLDKKNVKHSEAKQLLTQSLDYRSREESKTPTELREVEIPEQAIPEQFFPPCVDLGLKGLRDGRKRFVFILLNFLTCMGWSHDQIEKVIKEWNEKNEEPLRETITVTQFRYHKQKSKRMLPPNCQNLMYYLDIGICKPDNLCKKIKNPVQYSKRKTKYLHMEKDKKK